MLRLVLAVSLCLAPIAGCTVHATATAPRASTPRPPRARAPRPARAPTVVVTPPAPARVIVRPR